MSKLAENQRVLAAASKDRIEKLTLEIQKLNDTINYGNNHTTLEVTRNRLEGLKEDLEQALTDETDRPHLEREDMKQGM